MLDRYTTGPLHQYDSHLGTVQLRFLIIGLPLAVVNAALVLAQPSPSVSRAT